MRAFAVLWRVFLSRFFCQLLFCLLVAAIPRLSYFARVAEGCAFLPKARRLWMRGMM